MGNSRILVIWEGWLWQESKMKAGTGTATNSRNQDLQNSDSLYVTK